MTSAYIIYDRYFDYDGIKPTVGGIQSYIRELCVLLIELGISPTVVQRGKTAFELVHHGTRVVGVPCKPLGKRSRGKPLLNAIKSQIGSADFVIWASDSIAVPVAGIRTIAIQHGIAFDLVLEHGFLRKMLVKVGWSRLLKALQRRSAILSFRNSSKTVCVDYNFLNWIRTFEPKLEKGRVMVVPNFSSVLTTQPKSASCAPHFLFARRFTEKRGVGIMAQAAEKILSEYRDVRFTFAGEGELESELASRFADDPRVFITRYSYDELSSHLADVDVAIVPSLGSEGTSLSLLEAMGSGCAVICSNVGGMTNIVIDGFNGIMIEPDADELYKAMRRLIQDGALRASLGENALSTVRAAFSLDRWRDQWRQILLESCL